MLTIRRDQMEALADAVGRTFAAGVVRRLRRDHPQALLALGDTEPARDAVVRRWIETAARYGIEKENNINTFVDWMIEHGSDFHLLERWTWVRPILEFEAWNEDGKIGAIESGLRETWRGPD